MIVKVKFYMLVMKASNSGSRMKRSRSGTIRKVSMTPRLSSKVEINPIHSAERIIESERIDSNREEAKHFQEERLVSSIKPTVGLLDIGTELKNPGSIELIANMKLTNAEQPTPAADQLEKLNLFSGFKFGEDEKIPEIKDFGLTLFYLGILVLLFCVLSIIVLFLNIDFREIFSATGTHNYVICYLINGVVTLDLLNLVRLQMRYRITKHATGSSMDPFSTKQSNGLQSVHRRFLLVCSLVMSLTDIGIGYLLHLSVYKTNLTQITFLLVIVALNFVKVLQLLAGVRCWTLLSSRLATKEQLQVFNEIIPKRIYFSFFMLSLMKILPFCQLVCSFFGELIAPYLPDIRLLLFFCLAYPLIMGFWQKLMSIIDEKAELNIDFLGESYSLMYAVLPYKMVYLSLDEPEVIGLLLGVKIFYKTLAYLAIPGYTTIKEYRKKKKIEQKKAARAEAENQQPIRRDQKRKTTINVKEIFGQFFDDPAKDKKQFMNKFLVLQTSDIFVNICVAVLLLVDKYILIKLGGYGMNRETSFMVTFMEFAAIELGIDIFFLIVYGLILKKMLFSGSYNFSTRFKTFYWNVSSHIVLAGAVLFFICYYIRYSIKFTA